MGNLSVPGEKSMALGEDDYISIGNFVQRHLAEWIAVTGTGRVYSDRDIDLRERMIRLEEELKAQRELMIRGFDQVDKRFEQVDKRFEQVDKRFEQVEARFTRVTALVTAGFTMVTVLVTVFKFVTP